MLIINMPIMTNNKIQGSKTNNQESPMCPSLHIKLRTYVQNKMYINLATKTAAVLGTRHEKVPT